MDPVTAKPAIAKLRATAKNRMIDIMRTILTPSRMAARRTNPMIFKEA
jgi:hypothetical protein